MLSLVDLNFTDLDLVLIVRQLMGVKLLRVQASAVTLTTKLSTSNEKYMRLTSKYVWWRFGARAEVSPASPVRLWRI